VFAKPTKDELDSLAKVSLDVFKPLLGYLDREIVEITSRLVTTVDVNQILRLQGRASELTEFIELVRQARNSM